MTDASGMFNGNEKLEYINLKKYNEVSELLVGEILNDLPENIVVCLTESSRFVNFLVELNKKRCPNIYCGDDWKTKQKIWIPENDTCYIESKDETTTTSINSYKSNDVDSDADDNSHDQFSDVNDITISQNISDRVSEIISYNSQDNIKK